MLELFMECVRLMDDFLLFFIGGLFTFIFFFCIAFASEIANYIDACAEAKRSKERRLKLFEQFLEENIHDTD